MPLKEFYRRNLPHIQRLGAAHFLTFRTVKGLSLSDPAKDIAYKHCFEQHHHRVTLHAFVVMSNHAHLLFTPLLDSGQEFYSLAEISRRIKGPSAREINKLLNRRGALWQDEGMDRIVRGNKEFGERLAYIQENPVAARLVRSPHDYKWLWLETVEPISLAKAAK
jgi:REP element-mobilizing transposase RayT